MKDSKSFTLKKLWNLCEDYGYNNLEDFLIWIEDK